MEESGGADTNPCSVPGLVGSPPGLHMNSGHRPAAWPLAGQRLLPRGEPTSQSCELLIPSLIPPAQTHPCSPFAPFLHQQVPPSLDTTWLPATCPPSPDSSGLWWPGYHPQIPAPSPTLTRLLPPQDAPPHQNALTSQGAPHIPGHTRKDRG